MVGIKRSANFITASSCSGVWVAVNTSGQRCDKKWMTFYNEAKVAIDCLGNNHMLWACVRRASQRARNISEILGGVNPRLHRFACFDGGAAPTTYFLF